MLLLLIIVLSRHWRCPRWPATLTHGHDGEDRGGGGEGGGGAVLTQLQQQQHSLSSATCTDSCKRQQQQQRWRRRRRHYFARAVTDTHWRSLSGQRKEERRLARDAQRKHTRCTLAHIQWRKQKQKTVASSTLPALHRRKQSAKLWNDVLLASAFPANKAPSERGI